MKKNLIKWVSVLSLLFIFVGCGLFTNDDDNNAGEEPTEQPAAPVEEEPEPVAEEPDDTVEVNQNLEAWMPRLDNVVYSYEGIGNEFASFKWNPQFNQENYYQIARNNGGTVMVEIYEYTDDEIVHVFSRPETYFRDNFTDIGTIEDQRENEVVLKAPIEVGTNWSSDEATYEITAVDAEIEVPAGTYTALEVTIEYEDTVIKRYYAEDVGLVYELTETEGLEIESKLEQVNENTPETLALTVYQSDDQAMGLDQSNAELVLNTNDPARVAMKELLSGETDGFETINLLPEGTEINYLFLNSEDVVEVDLSSEYVSNMNAGSSGELLYLAGLVNTLSQYYGVQEVLLTIDGGLYESGHISLGEGETMSFDEEIVNE